MRAIVLSCVVLTSCAAPKPSAPPAPAGEPTPFDTRISLDLNKATLQVACELIARSSGLNIVLNRNDGTSGIVTMSVKDVPAGEVLEAVAKTFGLKMIRGKDNIVRITS